jgi:predicted nucleotidyltransferase
MNRILSKKQRRKKIIAPLANKIQLISSLLLDVVDEGIIKKIYLFGSYVYGKPKKTSDIDICVVIDDQADRIETYMKMLEPLIEHKIRPCDLIVTRESDFYGANKINSIENTIINYGMLLYG